ncbi:recombinase family protein [Glycocaulis profundi]|nr:recombinase family protein [Glycocaulis profundi]
MPRAAIYARFSTELQNERSTEDQIDLCRTYAGREGLEIVATFEDKAQSGASMFGRDGLLDLIQQAKAGMFEVIIVEALDRLSRDMEDLAGIHKRLTFSGVEIRAVHEGVVNTVLVGLRGLVGQLYREDNVHKIKRGMAGLVNQGKHAGGLAYGYRPAPDDKGRLVIVEDEADVIRRIFREYSEGRSPRAIAHDLNAEGIAAPRGSRWNASTINGNRARGYGILHNRLYAGEIVWNRVRMVKDPDTGKRVSRVNPEADWKVHAAEEYRIVEAELWQAVQTRVGRKFENAAHARRPKRILSGLLRCCECGGGMSTKGKDKTGRVRVRCTAHAESGTCPNSRTFYLDHIESQVLGRLAELLADPRLMTEYVEEYVAERKRLTRERDRTRSRKERRVGELKREAERIADSLIASTGPINMTLLDRLNAVEQDMAALRAELEAEPESEPAIALHPAAVSRYRETISSLSASLLSGADADDIELKERLRSFVDTVTVWPHPEDSGDVTVQITGKLNALLGVPTPTSQVGGKMVAEEGLEPPTRGL